MPQKPDISIILVQRLKERDVTALDYIYDYYSDALFGVIKRTVQSDMLAEEVLHDALLKIWNQIDQFDPAKGKFFTWMYRIARNQALDMRRSRDFKASEKSNDMDDYVNILTDETKGSDSGLLTAIKNLGEKCYSLIRKNFFEGYSHKEIAENTDMPLGTVKTRLRKCLNNLRESLKYDFG